MTFTLVEVLLLLIAGMLVVVAGLLIWMVVRVSQVSGKVEEALADVHRTIARIDGVAETVEAGVALARQAIAPSLTRFAALVRGIKRGFEVLQGPIAHEEE